MAVVGASPSSDKGLLRLLGRNSVENSKCLDTGKVATVNPKYQWINYYDDGFETHTGPLWFREEPDGSARCTFWAEKKAPS